jgi:hypothetical protein
VAAWLPAPIGLVALNGMRQTVARWGREDEGLEPVAAEPVAAEQAPKRAFPVGVPAPRPESALPVAA